MYHSGYGCFSFRFYGKTITAVAHCDNGILQIVAGGRVIHKIGELRMDTVIHATDRFADFKQRRACIISNFIFPDHTAFDLFK